MKTIITAVANEITLYRGLRGIFIAKMDLSYLDLTLSRLEIWSKLVMECSVYSLDKDVWFSQPV